MMSAFITSSSPKRTGSFRATSGRNCLHHKTHLVASFRRLRRRLRFAQPFECLATLNEVAAVRPKSFDFMPHVGAEILAREH
jgi:hypothetical protein